MVKQKRQTFPLQFTLGVKVTIYYCFYTHTHTHTRAYNYHLQSIALLCQQTSVKKRGSYGQLMCVCERERGDQEGTFFYKRAMLVFSCQASIFLPHHGLNQVLQFQQDDNTSTQNKTVQPSTTIATTKKQKPIKKKKTSNWNKGLRKKILTQRSR